MSAFLFFFSLPSICQIWMLCILKYKACHGYDSAGLFSSHTMSKHNLGVWRQPTCSFFCVSLWELTFSHKRIKADSALTCFLRTLLARKELVKFNLLKRRAASRCLCYSYHGSSVGLASGWRPGVGSCAPCANYSVRASIFSGRISKYIVFYIIYVCICFAWCSTGRLGCRMSMLNHKLLQTLAERGTRPHFHRPSTVLFSSPHCC